MFTCDTQELKPFLFFFSLKIYKFQLIRDNKLKEEESTTEHNSTEPSSSSTTGTSESSHTASESGHTASESTHATSESTHTTSESNQAETSESATSATHNAKRAIQLVSDVLHQDTTDYNPVVIANTIQNDTNLSSKHHQSTWCKYIASSITYVALQTVTSYYCEDRQLSSSSHLMRRSEAASEDGSFAGTVSNTEIVFVYKTFLIFGGLILIINSIIKAINTRIAGKKDI